MINFKVLILISVEDGFCGLNDKFQTVPDGLNPYFCGRWFLCRVITVKE